MIRLESRFGLCAEINANGSIRRLCGGELMVNLFVGQELEGGPANVWLRRPGKSSQCAPLLGARSGARFWRHSDTELVGAGRFEDLRYRIALVLADSAPAWFWHVDIENTGAAREIELIYAQDLALAPYATVRLNEFYVSQYVDHTPLAHTQVGHIVASRQNLAAGGRHPWCVIGSLRRAVSFATDALQVHGLASRTGTAPSGVLNGLPGRRLQHEHSMASLQDAPLRLDAGETARFGFFGFLKADHPAATSAADLSTVDEILSLEEARRPTPDAYAEAADGASESLFSTAASLTVLELGEVWIDAAFGERRHEERDERGSLLSFFCGDHRHVVLREKELRVLRPHGCLLRTGRGLTPDESALTSTVWMGGVFHSMVTQGHVSINRMLSTVRSYLGLFRAHGLRVFAQLDGEWRRLDVPSAFEMTPDACRWIYRHAHGELEVRSEARSDPHALTLQMDVREGAPVRFLVSHHIALDGDDGSVEGAVTWRREGENIAVAPTQGSDLHRRFPQGSFLIAPEPDTAFERVGGDELLFLDGRSREQPYLCVITAPAKSAGMRLQGRLIPSDASDAPSASGYRLQPTAHSLAHIKPPPNSPLASSVTHLADIAPWFIHNALVHYLSPRGLEQFSGGGWGTRDVCQGPLELLLSMGRTAPVRDLLLRVMRAQKPDGDWPQWFMFYERDRDIRAGDSHGDIVFWPVLALAQYLIASGDAGVLDESEPFHASDDESVETATVWAHVQRALALIEQRVIGGTALAAYGHGDWNDALQPANPTLREHMCSAWTVTLNHQTLTTLAKALSAIGRDAEAAQLHRSAEAVLRDFQRVLLVDGVLTGYALFEAQSVHYLLHPRDATSEVRYSSLAMIHAILEGMFTPEQMREHLLLIDEHLTGPDGVRLFDRPLSYHGGPQTLFQRAESATFFGREIGLMYMHAHLRYAQALAHVGEAERFFHALRQANPIGVREFVPQAALRQSNCYYSSSDATFADRYEASAEYERVRSGEIALEGGWRVYSSGAGIAMSLIMRRFLGFDQQHDALIVDPVMPASLNGLRAEVVLYERPVSVVYEVSGAGCGVTQVEVNGKTMTLTFESNPYRKGAARIERKAFVAALDEGQNRMRVRVG